MADWSKYTLAVDIAYSNTISDYAQFVQNNVRIAFIKVTQGATHYDRCFDTHWHKCREAGMFVGAYHFFDPRSSPTDQLKWIKRYYRPAEADFPITIDCENLPGVKMAEYSNAFLIKQIGNLWGLLSKEYGKKPIIYTGLFWWNKHMVPAPAWISQADFWVASYPYKSGRVNVTWDTFKTDWLPQEERWVGIPSGGTETRWWQLTGDKFCLPGVNGPIDINLYKGAFDDCLAHYGIDEDRSHKDDANHALTYPRYVTTAKPFLNIRSGPGQNFADIGDLYPNIPVTGYEEKDNWVKIDPLNDKWVNKAFLAKIDQ
jgi:GH25 family lysozyme M1 (1,4-beta-N-acetylmuramidase)